MGKVVVSEIEKTINRSYHVPKMMDPYVKSQSQVRSAGNTSKDFNSVHTAEPRVNSLKSRFPHPMTFIFWNSNLLGQDVLEIPKPDTPAKMNILAFSDSMGYCKNLFANVPEGRISMKKVVENYHTLTQEDVKRLVTEPKKGWDMVIFAVGCDPPRSNSIDDVIEQNTVISRLCLVSYFGAPAKSLKQLLPLSDEFGRFLIYIFFLGIQIGNLQN